MAQTLFAFFGMPWYSTSGGGYTLAAGAGTFTLTGQAASIKVSRRIACGTGSFVLSGQAATFTKAYVLNAGVGAFLLTGKAARICYEGDIWNCPLIDGYTFAEVLRGVAAFCLGNRNNGPGGTIFAAAGGSEARITTTADTNGDGTATLSLGTPGTVTGKTLESVIEGTMTAKELMRGIAAVVMGERANGPGGTVFSAIDGSKVRVTTTADSSGNGTAVLDLS